MASNAPELPKPDTPEKINVFEGITQVTPMRQILEFLIQAAAVITVWDWLTKMLAG